MPLQEEKIPGPAIYVLAAHPNWRESRVNRRLLEAARGVAGADVCDLYASYDDYDIDAGAEQGRLARAQLVVLVHPIHWYSMPALQKLWLDEVLAYGWAYGTGGDALRGKDLWLVATTGGPQSSYHPSGYNRYFFDAFLPPYEQTAALCGMRFLPPLLLHGAHMASEDAVTAHTAIFLDRLRNYPQWPELDDLEQCPACEVPPLDRPLPVVDRPLPVVDRPLPPELILPGGPAYAAAAILRSAATHGTGAAHQAANASPEKSAGAPATPAQDR